MYLCPVVYISVGECKRVCVSHTVKALLVDYSAAGQGFIVLLVTHQRVHAQDGWKKRRRLKNEHLRKKKDRERESKRAVLTLSGLIDWLATLDQTTMHQSLSASQSRQAWGKKKKKEKNLHTVWIQLPCTGFDFCNHSWPSALSRPKPNQCAIYFICYKKNNEISASQGKKNLWCALAAGNLKYVSSQAVTLRTQLTESLCLVTLSERLRVSDCLFDYWMQWSACIATS